VEVDERPGGGLIRVASAVEPEWLLEHFPDHVEEQRGARFDPERERVERVTSLTYDGLVLDESRGDPRGDPDAERVLRDAAFDAGFTRFCDPEALERLQRRAAFACAHGLTENPVHDDVLRDVLTEACTGAVSFAEVRDARPLDLLLARMPADVRARLDRLAPEHVSLPSRRRVPIRYEPGKPPWIASRLQDFFGLTESPRVADGQVPLVLHLLAPNRRAVQVTTDLAGFWTRHYPSLRKTLMRRYPRHPWPETPT
jgi:ATP-dependent helicase HrpB